MFNKNKQNIKQLNHKLPRLLYRFEFIKIKKASINEEPTTRLITILFISTWYIF